MGGAERQYIRCSGFQAELDVFDYFYADVDAIARVPCDWTNTPRYKTGEYDAEAGTQQLLSVSNRLRTGAAIQTRPYIIEPDSHGIRRDFDVCIASCPSKGTTDAPRRC